MVVPRGLLVAIVVVVVLVVVVVVVAVVVLVVVHLGRRGRGRCGAPSLFEDLGRHNRKFEKEDQTVREGVTEFEKEETVRQGLEKLDK